MPLTYSEIMIRYGELSTKGKNRMRFINKLRNNISDVLSIYPAVKVTADRDRAHAYLNGTDYEPVAESLKQVFGIQNFSPVYKIEKSVPALISAVQEIMQEIYQEGMTFKISSRRSDHKSKSGKKQPISLTRPLKEQVVCQLGHLEKGCSCYLVGLTLQ